MGECFLFFPGSAGCLYFLTCGLLLPSSKPAKMGQVLLSLHLNDVFYTDISLGFSLLFPLLRILVITLGTPRQFRNNFLTLTSVVQCIRVHQRNIINRMYTHVCRERSILKNWLMGLWGLASPQSEVPTGRVETQGRVHVAVQVWRQSGTESSLSQGISVFSS